MITQQSYYGLKLKRFEEKHLPYIEKYHGRTIKTGRDEVTGAFFKAGDVVAIGQYLSEAIPKWEMLKYMSR